MPKVGNKHYSYTAGGRKAAAAQAKRTGKKVTNTRKRGKR